MKNRRYRSSSLSSKPLHFEQLELRKMMTGDGFQFAEGMVTFDPRFGSVSGFSSWSDSDGDSLNDRISYSISYTNESGSHIQLDEQRDLENPASVLSRSTVETITDQAGNTLTQSYTWGVDITSGYVIDYEYNEAGQEIRNSYTSVMEDGNTNYVSDTTLEYDESGFAIKSENWTDNDGDGSIDIYTVNTCENDDQGRPLQLLYSEDRGFDGVTDRIMHQTYSYDADGNQSMTSQAIDSDGDGVYDNKSLSSWNYDEQGRVSSIVSEEDRDGDGVWDSRGNLRYEYLDENGSYRHTSENDMNADGQIDDAESWTYWINEDAIATTTIHEIDSNGDGEIDVHTVYDDLNETSSEGTGGEIDYQSEFDESGRIVFQQTLADTDNDGIFDYRSVSRYTYGNDGQSLSSTYEFDGDNDGTFESQTTHYYDSNDPYSYIAINELDENDDGVVDFRESTTQGCVLVDDIMQCRTVVETDIDADGIIDNVVINEFSYDTLLVYTQGGIFNYFNLCDWSIPAVAESDKSTADDPAGPPVVVSMSEYEAIQFNSGNALQLTLPAYDFAIQNDFSVRVQPEMIGSATSILAGANKVSVEEGITETAVANREDAAELSGDKYSGFDSFFSRFELETDFDSPDVFLS